MLRKILIVLLLNVVMISVTLSVMSFVMIHKSIDQSLQSRLDLARSMATHIEMTLNRNMNRLVDIANAEHINLNDNDWAPEQRMLETAYRVSVFTEGAFLLDRHGNMLLAWPQRIGPMLNLSHIPAVRAVISTGEPVISDLYTIEPSKKKVLFVLTPLKNSDGTLAGIAGGMLGQTSELLNELIVSAKVSLEGYAEIVDSNEVVLASFNQMRILHHHDHGGVLKGMIRAGHSGIVECEHGYAEQAGEKPSKYILAVYPLHRAPWAVVVGQEEQAIFAPAYTLQMQFIPVVLVFIGLTTFISFRLSRKLVAPLQTLAEASQRIASGDIYTPVGDHGGDEILELSKRFEDMRQKLADSLASIHLQNEDLENRVAQRTLQIREGRRKIRFLLKKVISSQEEERRRVARDLHDTILQDVSAFLIQLDICRMRPELVTVEKIDEMRQIVTRTIDNIHVVIKDLRPSLVDDLGTNASIKWLLDRHLAEKGIAYYLDVASPLTRRLPSELETTLFRVFQEAIINVARHAKAANVFVTIDAQRSKLEITIEDDGVGFDTHELMRQSADTGRGLGLLGMQERLSLVDGKMRIHSKPGEGTRICLQIPIEAEAEHV